MNRFPAIWARVGTSVAALAATALIGVPTVAYAADALPDLSISFQTDPVADIDNSGTWVGVYVYNYGQAPASAVTLTLDLSKLSDDVVATVPESPAHCKLESSKITCPIGQLEAGQTGDVTPVVLASRTGAAIGPAGEVTVTIDGAEDDANPADNTTTFPVTVKASGPDLVVLAKDLTDKNHPVGPGDRTPLYTAVGNEGDTTATASTITLNLPTPTTLVEQYSDCTYVSYFPKAGSGGGYIYGPGQITCPLPEMAPGDGFLLYDPVTGESLFNVTYGRNLPGPEQSYGNVLVALAGEALAAKGAKRVAGDGPSFAGALKKLQAKNAASKSAMAKQKIVLQEIDESDNYADFSFWTKKNTLDVQVNAKPISGQVGQTVDLPYEIVNRGPSDGGGPSALITAPSGTVLLPAEWCWTDGTPYEQRPESTKLRCNFESEFPTVASGYGRIKQTLKLKIKSTPGSDGTIYAESCCVGSTESNKANNTARIVFSGAAAPPGEGGSGGGLPITGSPVALVAGIGGAVVVIGVVLMFVFRRRRVVVEVPRD